mmetsp:Transcript_69373/g.122504  ORF Transcript_69373/g.122504 Transcript_69373/m.122504 type:complete len:94 (+) Transcript_69373:2282-2563(+)
MRVCIGQNGWLMISSESIAASNPFRPTFLHHKSRSEARVFSFHYRGYTTGSWSLSLPLLWALPPLWPCASSRHDAPHKPTGPTLALILTYPNN